MKSAVIFSSVLVCSGVFLAACQPTFNTTDPTPSPTAAQPSPGVIGDQPSVPPLSSSPVPVSLEMDPDQPIAVNLERAANLTTLVAVLKQAGLNESLSGPGPYTLFAPSNAAFEQLPLATLQGLMTADRQQQLQQLLNYHLLLGRQESTAWRHGQRVMTVQGQPLTVLKVGEQWQLRDAQGRTVTIETPDLPAANGVIHVTDQVLLTR